MTTLELDEVTCCRCLTKYSIPTRATEWTCNFCSETQSVYTGPPTILCAGCGHELQRLEDIAFHCPACNRVVRP